MQIECQSLLRLIAISAYNFVYSYYVKYICIFVYIHIYVVPIPDVSMVAPEFQMVGQSLALECNVTTVRGITSRVDIVWSDGNMELDRTNDTTATTMDDSLVYTDSYTISQLSTTDDGRVIQCEVVINASPSIMASDNTTLDVTSKCLEF